MEHLKEIINKFKTIITNIYINEKNFFVGIQEFDKNDDAKYCLLIIIILMYIVIIATIFNYNIINFYKYLINQFLNSLRINSSLINYPEYSQILKLFHINDSISFNISAIMYFILLLTIFLIIVYIWYSYNDFYNNESIIYITIWSLLGTILMLTYIIINFYRTIELSNKNNLMIDLLYKHISYDYLDKTNICNYNAKPDVNSIKSFSLGKCNDLNSNNSILISYIKDIIGELQSNYSINIINITSINDFKSYVDANGISYYNKIIDVLFTNTLINYFIKNNLINEAADFFSKKNLKKSYINKFFNTNNYINPITYIRFNDLALFESNYNYNNFNSAISNKIIFYNIIQDYNKLQDNISNIITDVINICQYKLTPPDYYYNYITYILIIMLIVYIISNSK